MAEGKLDTKLDRNQINEICHWFLFWLCNRLILHDVAFIQKLVRRWSCAPKESRKANGESENDLEWRLFPTLPHLIICFSVSLAIEREAFTFFQLCLIEFKNLPSRFFSHHTYYCWCGGLFPLCFLSATVFIVWGLAFECVCCLHEPEHIEVTIGCRQIALMRKALESDVFASRLMVWTVSDLNDSYRLPLR